MERINLQVLDTIVELADEKFSEQFSTIAKNFDTNPSNNELEQFLKEFQSFSMSKLEIINPYLKTIPLYLNYIFNCFISHQTKDQYQLFKEIIISIYEKNIIKCFINDLNINFEGDDEISQKLNEFSRKFLKASIIEELTIKYFVLVAENYLPQKEFNEEQLIKDYADNSLKIINEAYHSFGDEEFIQICIIDTISSFEYKTVISAPSSFSRLFNKHIWTNIKIPFKFKKNVILHSKRIDELTMKKSIEEELLNQYGKQLLNFKNDIITQKEFKKLDKIFESISNSVDVALDRKFKYGIQQEIFKHDIMYQVFSLLSGANGQVDLSNISRHFKSLKIESDEAVINTIVLSLNEGYKRNFESLANESYEKHNPDKVQELSKMIIDTINEIIDEHLYMHYEIDGLHTIFVGLIFKSFYKIHYQTLPKSYHFHILTNASRIIGCHVSKIDPTENINLEYVSEWILFKVQPCLIKMKDSLSKLLKEKFDLNDKKNLEDISIINKRIEDITNQHINLMKEIKQEIHDIFSVELEIYVDDAYLKSEVATSSLKEIDKELLQMSNDILKNTWYNYFKERKMNLTNEMIKLIEKNLEEMKAIQHENIDYNKKISEMELVMNETNYLQNNSIFAQQTVIDNFFKDLRTISESIHYRIPHIQYLMEELTAAQYIVFAFILEINLQGNLLDITEKKFIEKIAGIAQKTVYDVLNALSQKKLILYIDEKKQLVLVNAPKILEIAKKYYKEKLKQ